MKRKSKFDDIKKFYFEDAIFVDLIVSLCKQFNH